MKTYTICCDGKDDVEIKVNDDQMIVYDVVNIKAYEGGDYLPRQAKQMDHHLHKELIADEQAKDWEKNRKKQVEC